MNRSESTAMNTNITTIGSAILLQTLVRYLSFIAMLWLVLSFSDGWIRAFLAA